jgi:hypothetical protein
LIVATILKDRNSLQSGISAAGSAGWIDGIERKRTVGAELCNPETGTKVATARDASVLDVSNVTE